jgi:DNA-binding transcriptional LysR family regulator
MAQPPLSVAIRQLEDELGTELFQRTTREVRLTEAGHVLLDGARRTIAEADRAVASAKRAGAGELGQLKLGFSWSARFETLPALGQALEAEHPDLELLAQEMWNAAMIPALRSGEVDVAVALCPELAPDVEDEVIRTEPVVAVLPSKHRLAGRESIPLSSLGEETFVFFARDLAPRLHDHLIGLCRSAGFEPKVVSGSFHSGWDLGLLGRGEYVAVAPNAVRAKLAEGVAAVPLSEPANTVETRLLWREDDSAPTIEALRSAARAAFK